MVDGKFFDISYAILTVIKFLKILNYKRNIFLKKNQIVQNHQMKQSINII